MGKSNIQWCDYTFNPWIGCRFATRADGTPIEECFHCYAKTLDDHRYSKTLDGASKEHPVSHWGSGPRHRTSPSNWKQPLAWNRKADRFRECNACGHRGLMLTGCHECASLDIQLVRPRVFCASLGDWLDDENVPIEWLAGLLFLIYSTPHLDWLLLTKRPQNWAKRMIAVMRYLEEKGGADDGSQELFNWVLDWVTCKSIGTPPANIWIGVSAGADQEAAMAIPARIHFLSCEPMLRPMDTEHAARFDWIIFGGESGNPRHKVPAKRPRVCQMDWIRAGLRFCREHGVTPFVKQMGSEVRGDVIGASNVPIHFEDSHGGEISEWPEDLRVREFPKVDCTAEKHGRKA